MENEKRELLQLIPHALRTPEQVAQYRVWEHREPLNTYRLRRKPVNLQELTQKEHSLAIWCNIGTLTYATRRYIDNVPDGQRYLRVKCPGHVPDLYIFGNTDNAIAITAAFFMSLHEPTEDMRFCFDLYMYGSRLDFRSAGPECFTRMWGEAPLRFVFFHNLRFSAEQSIALTTSPNRVLMAFNNCEFDDEGTAFVSESKFGSLKIKNGTKLHNDNLEGLLRIGANKIGEMELPLLENSDLALLALSVNVNSLHYCISAALLLETDFQSVNIPARELALTIRANGEPYPTEAVQSFFRRVADLGHFVELKVHVGLLDVGIPDCVVRDLISAALANPNLEVLDLWEYEPLIWGPHLEALFNGLKVHQGLRILKLHASKYDFGPDFSHLKMLLSHHRNIEVTDKKGNRHVDDKGVIVELYSLNRFYRESPALARAPSPERLSLVATTLVEAASGDFRRSALLLSKYMDSLIEMVQFADLEEL